MRKETTEQYIRHLVRSSAFLEDSRVLFDKWSITKSVHRQGRETSNKYKNEKAFVSFLGIKDDQRS